MPLEAKLFYLPPIQDLEAAHSIANEDCEEEFLGIVKKGPPAVPVVSDFSGAEEKVIMAGCIEEDYGGPVYIVKRNDFINFDKGSKSLKTNVLERNVNGTVGLQSPYERIITTQDQRLARLVIRYTFLNQDEKRSPASESVTKK